MVAKRQCATIGAFLVIFALALLVLFVKDRQREWRLRVEQSDHRLELAYELITRDLGRVRSDILNLASQRSVQEFEIANEDSRKRVETEFGNFLRFKQTYQQLRLLDVQGLERVRVDLRDSVVSVIPDSELQDKKDRYYFRESLGLNEGDVFISEFDLNQEHGLIEQPLNPVVRFATPIHHSNGKLESLLVANYLGAPLLNDLSEISLPGKTFVIREDGQYLLGPQRGDSWGWLLDHSRTFGSHFPDAWSRKQALQSECTWTPEGAFAFRKIEMQRFGRARMDQSRAGNQLLLVSFLPAAEVFATSNQLLNRLLILAAIMILPLFILTRFWAEATVRRQQQNLLIIASEKKLRELSFRLVRIQEEERRAISREIHDQLGQQVTAINLDLKLAQRESGSDKNNTQLQRAIGESEQLLESLHQFAMRIRPVELDDLGLHDAVESHLWEFQNRTGIEFDFKSNVDSLTISPMIAENVYRLVQESLNNVLKHANAKYVCVSIERVDKQETNGCPGETVLKMVVEDDGVGTSNPMKNQPGENVSPVGQSRLGLLGMRERVDLLGGTFELAFGAESGTTVSVTVPLNDSADVRPPDSRNLERE